MDGGRLLQTIGLVRQARPGGFCPACRLVLKALDGERDPVEPVQPPPDGRERDADGDGLGGELEVGIVAVEAHREGVIFRHFKPSSA